MNAPTSIPVAQRRFVLPDDVAFVPIEQFSAAMRASMGGEDGDVAVTRPGYRVPSRLLDHDTAALLQCFRPACTIAHGVIRFCRDRGLDPERTLDEAFAALQLFARSHILVPEDSPDAAPLRVSWSVGQVVGDVEILELLQHTADSEVYRVRLASGRLAALKRARAQGEERYAEAIEREAEILRHLDGRAAPRLLGAGTFEGSAHVRIEWIDGVPVSTQAARIRSARRPGWPHELHRLAIAVVEAYATLHEAGIVHADVHPGNVLVRPEGEVTLIDFGLARRPGGGPLVDHEQRGGFGWALDPLTAQALLDGVMPPPLDPRGEQYSVATLLYELYAGAGYLEFSSQAERAQQQILADAPLPFAHHGLTAWTQVESVLRRALAKSPDDRFASMRALGEALRQASPPSGSQLDRAYDDFAREHVDGYVARLGAASDPGGFVAPTASLDRGAAGLAWLLLRLGVRRADPHALGLADLWARRARASLAEPDAFHVPRVHGEDFVIDPCSVAHRAPGVHFVGAMICLARTDFGGLSERVGDFVASVSGPHRACDLTLGRAGVLCAMTTLVEASRRVAPFVVEALAPPATACLGELSARLDDDDPAGLLPHQPASMAHGWVGLLYAILRAVEVLDVPEPARLRERVQQVATLIETVFPEPTVDDVPGWCNGAAGQVQLLVEAHRRYGDPRLLAGARRAATRAAAHPDRHGHLCCGLAGRVFALLDLARHTGEQGWCDEARRLARRLADAPMPAEASNSERSLLWGRAGAVLAVEEARDPQWAAMPIFGRWGYPRPSSG